MRKSSLHDTLRRVTRVGGSSHLRTGHTPGGAQSGTMKKTVLELRHSGGGESVGIEWTGTEGVNMNDGKHVDDERVGPIICGKQAAHVGLRR